MSAALLCGLVFAVSAVSSYAVTVESDESWLEEDSRPATPAEFRASVRERVRVSRRSRQPPLEAERDSPVSETDVHAPDRESAAAPTQSDIDDPRAKLELDMGLHRLLKDRYAIYQELGALEAYRREQDPVPVRPLIPIDGITDEDLTPYLEAPEQTFARLGALANDVPNPLRNETFAVAAWPNGDEFTFTAGIQADSSANVAPVPRVRAILRKEGLDELDSSAWSRAIRIALNVGAKAEANRRAAWEAVRVASNSAAAEWLTTSDVSGILVHSGRVHVVRRGDDAELDRLAHELAQARRAVSAQMASDR